MTSRYVVVDERSRHHPDRIGIELHIDVSNMAESTGFSIPLFRNGTSVWRRGCDSAGEIDVAVIELERGALPATTVYRVFAPRHLLAMPDSVEVGSSLLIVGLAANRS